MRSQGHHLNNAILHCRSPRPTRAGSGQLPDFGRPHGKLHSSLIDGVVNGQPEDSPHGRVVRTHSGPNGYLDRERDSFGAANGSVNGLLPGYGDSSPGFGAGLRASRGAGPAKVGKHKINICQPITSCQDVRMSGR